MPPPNVTGALHMGHALTAPTRTCSSAGADAGRRAKWIFGTDHAGIATQVKVEQALRTKAPARRSWAGRRSSSGCGSGARVRLDIDEQFRRLGASLDYEDERFTMDEGYASAVREVFVRLYEKGLVYRDNYMVNWDPGTRSAISDLEVEQRSVDDTLYSVDYPLASGSGSITVATVRPETMLADTAIAVHPYDERYTRLIGERGDAAARRPAAADHRRRVREDRVRHRRAQDHPGPRPQRLRDRPHHGLEEISVIGEDGLMTARPGSGSPA